MVLQFFQDSVAHKEKSMEYGVRIIYTGDEPYTTAKVYLMTNLREFIW